METTTAAGKPRAWRRWVLGFGLALVAVTGVLWAYYFRWLRHSEALLYAQMASDMSAVSISLSDYRSQPELSRLLPEWLQSDRQAQLFLLLRSLELERTEETHASARYHLALTVMSFDCELAEVLLRRQLEIGLNPHFILWAEAMKRHGCDTAKMALELADPSTDDPSPTPATVLRTHPLQACFPVSWSGIVLGITELRDVVALHGPGLAIEGHGGTEFHYTDTARSLTMRVTVIEDSTAYRLVIAQGVVPPAGMPVESVPSSDRIDTQRGFWPFASLPLGAPHSRLSDALGPPAEYINGPDGSQQWIYPHEASPGACFPEGEMVFSLRYGIVDGIEVTQGGE